MSSRYNRGSHYENHQRAAELHDLAAHSHRAAEQHGKQEHLTGHEHSRQALEHSQEAYERSRAAAAGYRVDSLRHTDIAARAHELWHARGRPDGSPQEDWFRAAKELGELKEGEKTHV